MKTVTTYTSDLLEMQIGETKQFSMRKYRGYATTASILKREGKGLWTSHQIDKKYFITTRIS